MKSWGNRTNFYQHVSAGLLSAKSGNPNDIEPELTEDLATWLGQLTLLYGMPVEYMVPDARLLPTESIRFFYIDRNWLDRLVDGAISVGVLSSKENIFNQAFFKDIYQQVDAAQLNLRNSIRSVPPAEVEATSGTMTGLLFRSQVVTAYPGVEIHAYDGNKNLLTTLRMDRLSNSLILCIFDGIPDQVDFIQPSEGLHFGIQREAGAQTFKILLRGLGFPGEDPQPNGYPPGKPIENPPDSGQFVRADGAVLSGASEGVIDIAGLVKNVETKLNGLFNPSPLKDGTLTPGGLAIQLTVGAGIQSYKIKAENGSTPPDCEFTGLVSLEIARENP